MKSQERSQHSDRLKRMGLGTVQFGMDYGIANRDGQTTLEEAKKIVRFAGVSGVKVIDTAAGYGESERVLGNVLPKQNDFKIVTKTIPCRSKKIEKADCALIESAAMNSLSQMNVTSVYGLLIHDAGELDCKGAGELFDTLLKLRQEGIVNKIGVSVYNQAQIDNVLNRFPIDIIQIPLNILDQRLIQSGHLKRLKECGVEIHARSTFLQGLLLMNPEEIDKRFHSVKDHLKAFSEMLQDIGATALEAAINFSLSIEEIDSVVIGVESLVQLKEIVNIVRNESPLPIDYSRWAWQDTDILDPSRWKDLPYEKEYEYNE